MADTGAWEYEEGAGAEGLPFQRYGLWATEVSGEPSDFAFLLVRCTQGYSLEVVIGTSHYIPGDSEGFVYFEYRFASDGDLIMGEGWSTEALRSSIYSRGGAFVTALRTASGPLWVTVVDELGATQYYTFFVDGAVAVFEELVDAEESLCRRS